jgi:uncharacterized repeat protein (TIGR01451 family)
MSQKRIPYRLAAVVIMGVIALVGLYYVDRAVAVNTSPDQEVLFSDDFSADLSQWNDSIMGSLKFKTESDRNISGSGFNDEGNQVRAFPENVLSLHLDDPEGSISFYDSSGYGNNATCFSDACPQAGVTGVHKSAIYFDGIDDYAQGTTSGFPTGNSDRSMVAWVRVDNIVTDNVFFIGYGGFDYNTKIYLLYAAGQTICFSQSGDSICGPVLDLGRWYHVAVTNVGDYLTLYLDGVEVATGSLTINTSTDSIFYLGSVPGMYGNIHKLNGSLDDAMLFTRALSSDEIKMLYQADLDARKLVDNNILHPGELVSYAITASNLITDTIDNVLITDTLPLVMTYEQGTLSASSGMANYQAGVITWTGSITASTTVTVSFGAKVSPTAIIGTSITNQALINAEGDTLIRSATIDIVPYTVFIPCASRACLPLFYDDFSNPASGWAIEGDNDYSMGYANGEYYIGINEGWIAWSMQDFGVSDYRVELDARASMNVGGGTGLMFEINEYGFYLFEISDGWYALWRVDAYYWDWIPLIDWTFSSAIRPGFQTNRMKVERIGNDITVYANGQKLGSVNDGYYHGSWIGMTSEAYSGYFDGRFDNFAVYTGSCVGTNTSSILLDPAAFLDPTWTAPGSGHTRPSSFPLRENGPR